MPVLRALGFVLITMGLLVACAPDRPGTVVASSPTVVSVPSSPTGLPSSDLPSIGLPSSVPPSIGEPVSDRPPVSVTADPPPASVPSALPEVSASGQESLAWTFVSYGGQPTDVVATVTHIPCQRIVGSHVTLTGTTATIAVLSAPRPAGVCAFVEMTTTVLIRAPGPVAGLKLVHAPVGR